jgi:hypothetical protein
MWAAVGEVCDMGSRPAVFALALGLGAVALLPGCHAGGTSGLSAKPAPTLPNVSLTATEAIEAHNLNAAKVQALEARPRISVDAPGAPRASVDGRMALERPRNFKLQMTPTMRSTPVADIGSNDDEFWFWTESKQDKNVYVCAYNDVDRAPLSSAFQPDWIVEAMGLRTISREEARQITSKPGDAYGTIKLVSSRRGKNGETLIKETVLDHSGRIKEHRLYQGQGKDRALLAYATIEEFRPIPVEGKETVTLPYRFRLAWVPEKLILDVLLNSPKVVAGFSEEDRELKFAEPEIPGMGRVNLAELAPRQPASASARAAEPTPSSRTHTTRATPSSRDSSIHLGAPEPFGVDDSARAPGDPVALSADLPADTSARSDPNVNRVVRPALPRAVDQ